MSTLTYTSYLRVQELLELQSPQSDKPEHDETLFIVIHQVYELWFKQLLHETLYLQDTLVKCDIATSLHTLRRMCTILKTITAQVDVLETMTPLSFASFRGRLQTASGFQSVQFRLIEFAMGHKNATALERFVADPEAHKMMSKFLAAPSVFDSFLRCLHKSGVAISNSDLQRDFSLPVSESSSVQEALISVYRKHPNLVPVCERLVDLDEGFQEWRYRHVKMVERTIGAKRGTGGSAGVNYLRSTLFNPFFPDLWAIRADL